MKKHISPVLLLITALIWGSAFVAQKAASEITPFALSGARGAIAVLAIIPIVILFDRVSKNGRRFFSFKKGEKFIDINGYELAGGVICGILLFVATALQQSGIHTGTDAGKAAFITALYVVIVPVFGLFLKRPSPLNAWISVGIAVVGFYLLCIKENFSVESSDMLILLCTFAFAAQILAVDIFLPKADGVRLSLIQFATVAILGTVFAFIFEGGAPFSPISECIPQLLFLGIGSSGIAYTLQIVGQKGTHPAVASIILSLESVFGALAGAVILQEKMSLREYVGCAVVFVAVILSELDFGTLFKKKNLSNENK